ncbi:MAG TPA: 4-hydroxy-tetrahydrodipicolinate reductase [Persephonella sp.]|uniref:4-hydroxy-tetrahydrodipicolinate reductase n=1 Tax=Persephonella marina (strain DSM 14350 / EX-H1) TaxID=123214 RepID=C0QU79_PERMH|nr:MULTISPECIES: 4-hydroxy-tetrahydrodipicolinate reductase [Persephonella]ACO03028.1 dihydrodipicolinate reductase [Persephonella marina EX-H1]HCB70141.1 4-hydroxy-tetrahydrodipicolinate reductase [Persephonella sp.]
MVKVVISGIMGRMGRTIARLAYEDPEVQIAGGVESPDCVHFHENVKDILNKEDVDAPITADLSKIIERADVIIDFAGSTEAVLGHVRLAAADQNRKCMVIGTTGFSDEELEEIRQLSKDIPIVLAPNMSIGVNLLFKLVEDAAKALKDKGFDIEVVEMHHRYKKDSPSGTAVKIVDILKEATGIQKVIYGREGIYENGRPSDEIAVFALRGGDVVGEHTVIFAGLGERIELTHRAGSRDIFAKGAVEAAKWIKDKPPGLYDMMDVLGLK